LDLLQAVDIETSYWSNTKLNIHTKTGDTKINKKENKLSVTARPRRRETCKTIKHKHNIKLEKYSYHNSELFKIKTISVCGNNIL
jgi:hypothetical protein